MSTLDQYIRLTVITKVDLNENETLNRCFSVIKVQGLSTWLFRSYNFNHKP